MGWVVILQKYKNSRQPLLPRGGLRAFKGKKLGGIAMRCVYLDRPLVVECSKRITPPPALFQEGAELMLAK